MKATKKLPQKVEISHRTIIFTVFFILFLWFLFFIRDILIQIFVALLLMTILNPFVTKLQKYRIPRALSILVVYIIAISLIVSAFVGIAPPLIEQTTFYVNGLPRMLTEFSKISPIFESALQQALSQLALLPNQIAKLLLNLFSDLLAVVTVLVFTFYMLLERNSLENHLENFVGAKYRYDARKILDLLEVKLGGWMIGQLSLMFLVGLLSYIGLIVIGIPFALPLAILAGLLEIVPYLGPVIAAIPAVIIGFGVNPLIGFAAAALAFLIQQLEGYLIVPKVMQKSTGVSPIVTLLSLAIGFKIAGVAGVLISVPAVVTLQVLARYFMDKNNL